MSELPVDVYPHYLNRRLSRMVTALLVLTTVTLLYTVHALSGIHIERGRQHNPDWSSSGRRLTFKNGKFKLIVFSDLHYGEREGNLEWAEWGVRQDAKSTQVMEKALEDEGPDFAVFCGDQIAGENQLWENSTVLLDQIFAPVKNHNVPFASVYGNHDESYNVSHASLYHYEKQKSVGKDLSWTQSNEDSSGDPKGQFNYFIPVYAKKKSKVPSLLLWFFDSRSGVFNSPLYHEEDEPWMSQDWVDPKVATWINATADSMRLQWGNLPKSLAFVHIPPSPVQVISNDSVGANHTGINIDVPVGTQGTKGAFWQNVDVDSPFWQAITGTLGGDDGSGLISITSGHDHGNDWCERNEETVGPYSFCFARHTGYGGYGDWARGSRVYELLLNKHAGDSLNSVTTWIRMEDHSTANSTILIDNGHTTLINTGEPAPSSGKLL